jgi:hypothetical protein
MRFNAWMLSRAWLSVALAQSDDDSRPALYRSTLIEVFDHGIRLVSTDSFLLLRAWVPSVDSDDVGDENEPGLDVLPDDVAICADRDQRVLALMRYAQTLTKHDGDDTPVVVEMAFGETGDDRPQGTLEGMAQSTVVFRLSDEYDERIETPIFEGVFPNWRPLWGGHKVLPTTFVGFGAHSIAKLGKLSALWNKAAIDFELGGTVGVSRIRIVAPDVFVSGLVMPTSQAEVPPSGEVTAEAEAHEFAEALDDFLADVLRTERVDTDTDAAIGDAVAAQYRRAVELAVATGYVSVLLLAATFGVDDDRAAELVEALVDDGVVDASSGAAGKHPTVIGAADYQERFVDSDPGGDEEPI